MSICEDSDRNLWIGSYRDGLAKLNPQTGHCEYIYLPDKDHKPAQSIYSIIEDKHRQLWVGAMGAGLTVSIWKLKKYTIVPALQTVLNTVR